MSEKQKILVAGQFNVAPKPNKTKKNSWWSNKLRWDKTKQQWVK